MAVYVYIYIIVEFLQPAVAKVNRLRHMVHGATATIFLTCISGTYSSTHIISSITPTLHQVHL